MWALLIVWYGTLGTVINPVNDVWMASTSVSGFQSESECYAAAAKVFDIQKKTDGRKIAYVQTQCIKVK